MPQYRISSISLNLRPDENYEKKVTVSTPQGIYKILDLPDDKELNRDEIIKLVMDNFNCKADDIIWPDYIEIPLTQL